MSINNKKWSELSMFERFKFMENTPTDCTFIVGITKDEIKRIPCHKEVLSQCSEVFSTMFNGNYLESEENCEIRLNDVQPYVFQYFMNFIYSGVEPFKWVLKDLAQLAYLSDKYMIRSLSNECERRIKDNCSVTLLDLVEYLKYPISDKLMKIITGYVRLNYSTDDILPSLIYNLNLSSFLVVIQLSQNNITSYRLFEMIENYVKMNFFQRKGFIKTTHDTEILCGANKIIIEQLLSMVQLEQMTAKEFVNGPMKSFLLDVHTKLNILIKISKSYLIKEELFKRLEIF
ncbi:BTB/POZ domain-containing protein 1-like [Teleopsis dalmanni]|uniref:BTB/POZ domain-containing protein 1-like n=1 Tax=Teleopsis dalmanni TaxID=139649 RepID=UPI0018CE23C9|nr:BTB/POZ domain-containing protein 1-like [Teleopsis dalmanni]